MDQNKQKPQQNRPVRRKKPDFMFYILIIIIFLAVWMLISRLTTKPVDVLSYSQYESYITEGYVETAVASPAGGENYGIITIEGVYSKDNSKTRYYVTLTMGQYEEISKTISEHAEIKLTMQPIQENFWLSFIISLIPYILLIGFFIFISKSQGNSKAFDFGKSTARLTRSKTVTFKDVAGCDEEKEELVEIIDFLKNPKKYVEIGARIPKGVLLFGPPGTGKTLLAKAVAGEANVPFFSISGSDFVEMFVGVGASRVRDMFKTAKENSPCIIFIDEIDAVGRQRGAGMGGGHDEREQTLNQLLVEMDGFNANLGIIVMAATNRPDVLDPALLRPGRFDRQITISNPDVTGREAILKVHARNKHFDDSVNFKDIAHRTPGFSGADIENLLNEAALLAARQNRKVINVFDIDEAIDRVMMGPAKKTRKITEKERRTVAFHEAGHAVIGLKLEDASIVQKVTIIPRGQAGGYNLMIPAEEHYLESRSSLLARITGFLGGRVSEEINFGDVTTGASNDFQNATAIARSMVTEYGMSKLGPVQYEQPQGSVFLGRDYLKEKNFSDQIALEIDNETRRIIEECYAKAKSILLDNMDLLNNIANYLLQVETLTKQDIDEICETGHLKRADKEMEDLKARKAELEAKIAEAERNKAEAQTAKPTDVIITPAPEVTEAKEETNEALEKDDSTNNSEEN